MRAAADATSLDDVKRGTRCCVAFVCIENHIDDCAFAFALRASERDALFRHDAHRHGVGVGVILGGFRA